MPRFSANLSLLFRELPLPERFQAAKDCGFDAIEIQFPYEIPAQAIRSAIDRAGLQLVLFNVPADDLMHGGEGLAAVPAKRDQFIQAVESARAYAEILHPRIINVLPGRCLQEERRANYLETFLGNLRHAADVFSGLGIRVVFEAVNTHDMPGFLISSGAQMLDVLHTLNHPNLFLQYDIYHMQTMGENPIEFIPQQADRIGHIQFADAPGRGEPGTGSIRFAELFEVIDNSRYQGWLGAEYKPTRGTLASLDWMQRFR